VHRAAAIALVAVFGAAGSASRYLVSSYATHHLGSRFPYGTMIVNLAGCLAIGILFETLGKHAPPQAQPVFIACGIGFLGGFTTFSSYALDSNLLWNRHEFQFTAINVVGSVAAGLALTRIGMWFAARFF
jgi:CrcB protein